MFKVSEWKDEKLFQWISNELLFNWILIFAFNFGRYEIDIRLLNAEFSLASYTRSVNDGDNTRIISIVKVFFASKIDWECNIPHNCAWNWLAELPTDGGQRCEVSAKIIRTTPLGFKFIKIRTHRRFSHSEIKTEQNVCAEPTFSIDDKSSMRRWNWNSN